MAIRTNRPHSPSARFYANRQSEGPKIGDMLPHPAPDQQHRFQLGPPFSDFQGFSAPPLSHRYIDNTCEACLSDERISPRTAIPYQDHEKWESPRQHMEQLSDVNDHMLSKGYGSPQHHIGGSVHTYGDSLSGPGRARQLSEPPTYITPPPQYFSSPGNAPVLAFAEMPISVLLPPREAPAGPLPAPVQPHVLGCNTIQVPSNSDVSDASKQSEVHNASARRLTTNEKGEPISISDDNEDVSSTVYPYDSTSMASSSTASRTAHGGGGPPRPLEAAVVEVHNACLAATQRYLESLRVNWELRRGHEILTAPRLAGPVRRQRDRAGARGSPYSLPQRTRRALSDNSGLEYMRGLRGGDEIGGEQGDGEFESEVEGRTQGRRQPPACSIPAPTDSLLQNTSRICELIWRRACRDRDDVLRAEAYGARRMGLLVDFAEAVVLYNAAEWEGDPERGFYTVCRAGRDFCRELGDMSGIGRVECIERGELLS